MKPMTMAERRDAYAASPIGQKYPASVPYVACDERLYGIWVLGQDYRSKSKYHGSHPPNYLERANALFPDAERVLHLFSGSLPKSDKYTRIDKRDDIDTDIQGDALDVKELVKGRTFDLIHADPPYTDEDAHKYGVTLVNRNKVVEVVADVLEPGGYLVWLDMILPMYSKKVYDFAGSVGMVRSTNHRFRCVTLFRKR